MSVARHLFYRQRRTTHRTRHRMRMTPGTARGEIVPMRMAPGAGRVARNSMRMRLGPSGTACGVFVPGAGNHLVPQIRHSKPVGLDPVTQNPVSERGRRIQRDRVTPAIATERAGKRHNHTGKSPPGLRTVSTKQSIHTNSFLQKVPKKISERKQEKPFCYTYSNLFITGQIDSMLTSCFIEAGFTFSEKKARAFLSTGLHRGTHGIVS